MLKYLFLAFLLLGCVQQAQGPVPTSPNKTAEIITVQAGDIVEINYVASANSSVFDTNVAQVAAQAGLVPKQSAPLKFMVGYGQAQQLFEDAVVGMRQGETKKVEVPPEQAFGLWKKELVEAVPRSEFNKLNLTDVRPGEVIEKGGVPFAVVREVGNDSVMVDFNHPLAGKTVTYAVTVVGLTRVKSVSNAGAGVDGQRTGKDIRAG